MITGNLRLPPLIYVPMPLPFPPFTRAGRLRSAVVRAMGASLGIGAGTGVGRGRGHNAVEGKVAIGLPVDPSILVRPCGGATRRIGRHIAVATRMGQAPRRPPRVRQRSAYRVGLGVGRSLRWRDAIGGGQHEADGEHSGEQKPGGHFRPSFPPGCCHGMAL